MVWGSRTLQQGLRTPSEYPGSWGNCNFDCEHYSLLYERTERNETTPRASSTAPRLDLSAYDFVANEAPVVTLHSSPRPPRILHIVVLREPCARTISHYVQEWAIFRQPFGCNSTRCRANREEAGDALVDASFASWFRLRRHNSFGIGCRAYHWYSLGATTLDNFQVRVLCGVHCASLPFGALTALDLTVAMERLGRLAIVPTTLERLSTPPGWGELVQLLGGAWERVGALPKVGDRKALRMPAKARSQVPSACPAEMLEHLEIDRRAHEQIGGRSMLPSRDARDGRLLETVG